MTLPEIINNINEGMQAIEVHSQSGVKSRKVFNERMAALNNMLETVEKGLQEYPVQVLMDVKYRIKHSIRIMEMADAFGIVSEP